MLEARWPFIITYTFPVPVFMFLARLVTLHFTIVSDWVGRWVIVSVYCSLEDWELVYKVKVDRR